MYVVDVSVIMSLLLTETYTSNAIAFFEQSAPPVQLCIPDFCKAECVNVLWKQVRFQGMAESVAEGLIADLMALPLRHYIVDHIYVDALKIGLRYQLAIYDSVYIALAKQLAYPLVTIDQRQSAAAVAEQVPVKPITDFVN
jgi:predicted nucleic acid-binding protein